jgi:tetratricopeptide (TPR) repeat protein
VLNDPTVIAGLATQLDRQGKTDEAITYYLKAIEIMPDPVAHYRVAQLLRGQGRLAEADEHLRAALQLRPDFMAARMALEASDKNPQSSESVPSAIRQQ